MLLDLLGDFAVIGFFVSVWTNLQDWSLTQSQNRSSLLFGALMGLAAIAAMMFSVAISTGIYFDLRTVAIAIATVFGGPLSGCIAAGMAAIFRTSLGGTGILGGVLSIFISLLVGMIGNALTGKRRIPNAKVFLFTGVLLAFVPLVGISVLPLQVRTEAYQFAAPVVGMLSFIAFLIGSYAISRNAELAQHRALLVAAIRQAPEYFYVKDTNNSFIATNHNWAVANGFDDSASLIGMSDFDISIAAKASEYYQEEQIVLTSGQPMVDKLEQLPGPDRSLRYFSTSKSAIKLGNGDVVGLVGITKDVTSLKLAEQEQEKGRNRLAFVLEEIVRRQINMDFLRPD
jgi:PAS domain S-box-containing protein